MSRLAWFCLPVLLFVVARATAQEAPEAESEAELEVLLSSTLQDLKADEKLPVALVSGKVDLQGYRITVPDAAKQMFVHVLHASVDIDLFLASKQAADFEALSDVTLAEAMTPRRNEILKFSRESGLKPGKVVLYAGSLAALPEEEFEFKLLLSFDTPPKLDGPELPLGAAKYKDLTRAVCATVELSTDSGGGSGTVVSPRGLIVTNLHVLENDEEPGTHYRKAWVAFSASARSIPQQAAIAKVLETDAVLDLALLQIETDLDGNKFESPDFVWLPLAAADMDLGANIRCLGYPAIGGSRSVTSITLTRGIVSGFEEKDGALRWYKSDCLLSGGNSGGCAINDAFEFAGIPTEALHDPDTLEFLSYIRPVSALPKAWRDTIAKQAK